MKYFLIFAVCLLIGISIGGGKFLPRTSGERSIVIALIIFLILLAIVVIWALAPYYLQ